MSVDGYHSQQFEAGSVTDLSVEITNCNSIERACVSLRRGSLNIKYGPNGIGKSTIARALFLTAQGDAGLGELVPFRFRGGGSNPAPAVSGADHIGRVLVFDESYVAQFVFQEDEVLKDSFEIFINTDEYREGIGRIELIFDRLKRVFVDNAELDAVITSFTELRDAFGVTKSGAISKTSRGFKALGVAGKLENVPTELRGYEKFLRGDDPAGWVSWQSKGRAYLEISENCPFCSVPNVDKAIANKVSEEYESAAVRNMSALRLVIERLGSSFAPTQLAKLLEITSSLEELSPEQSTFLTGLRAQIETLLGKFTALKGLSFTALRDVDNVEGVLQGLKIDLELLDALDSEATRGIVDTMNDELDVVTEQLNEIRAEIGKQRSMVSRLIRENQTDINDFLRSAGYRYSVRIEPQADSYRMILEHNDLAGHLESASRHLSYGERNAFALVLFMHHVRRYSPDLVILDDPVSSFDKTKKFAILHELFHGKRSIAGSTTLLLTHDIEPAIDVVRNGTSRLFQSSAPVAHFLRGRDGVVTEKEILRDDIMTFSQVCTANIESSADDLIKCIYLRRRLEMNGDTGAEYDVLSSLLHGRAPSRKDGRGDWVPLDPDDLQRAIDRIREDIPGFDSDALLSETKDLAVLRTKFESTDVGYERVQIFRVASELVAGTSRDDPAFKKFVNESYHIENEYVMQLNPRDFDAVPEHVVTACAEILGGA